MSKKKRIERRLRAQGKNRHHVLPRSRGGTNDPTNIVWVDKEKHQCWHALFGNKTPFEAIQEIISQWTSDIEWVNEIEQKKKEVTHVKIFEADG